MTAAGWPQRRARWRRRTRDPWADPAPIRSEIFGVERFERHAQSLADSQTVIRTAPPVVSLLERLREDAAALATAYDEILDDVHNKRGITPAAEWIIDNFHIVETQVRQVREDLPRDYFRQLPKLGPGFLSGHPRVFGIMWAYVAHTDSLFDPDLLARYVRAYETRKPLTLGELWAVAITLRLLLVENLRRLADLVVASSRDRQVADEVADRLLAPGERRVSIEEAVTDRDRGVPSRAFSVRLLRRLRGQDRPDAEAWLAARLTAAGLDPEVLVLEEHQNQASATVTVRNIFTSLRLISDLNWPDWVESVSLIEEQMRANPGYAGLDFPTRNLYRSAVEDLARGSHQQELDVARAALIRAEYSTEEVERDVGYWLLDDGRADFATAIDYRAPWRRRFAQFARGLGVWGYLAALTAMVIVLLGPTMWGVAVLSDGLSVPALVVLGVLASIPISDLALGLVNFWSARWFVASILPGLALRDGVPEESRTLVAIPTMLVLARGHRRARRPAGGALPGQQRRGDLLRAGHRLDGPSPSRPATTTRSCSVGRAPAYGRSTSGTGTGSSLLTAPAPTTPARAVDGMGAQAGQARRARPATGRCQRYRPHRPARGACPGRSATCSPWTVTPSCLARRPGAWSARSAIRSTGPGSIRSSRRPVRGLRDPAAPGDPFAAHAREDSSLCPAGLLAPNAAWTRTPSPCPTSTRTCSARARSRARASTTSRPSTAALAGRVPENTLLSHDLLEGNYARSGLVTDVEVVEEYPTRLRGRAPRAPIGGPEGTGSCCPGCCTGARGSTGLGLWKMVDNLRRSLSPDRPGRSGCRSAWRCCHRSLRWSTPASSSRPSSCRRCCRWLHGCCCAARG